MIRVALADDHHLVRQGIRALLEKDAEIEVIGEAENGQEAVQLVEKLKPDVLVMDVAMPRLNGLEAASRVLSSTEKTKVVMLSMYSDETLVRQAVRNGVSGYLLKRSVSEELLLAIRAAVRGETYLSPGVSKAVLTDLLEKEAGEFGLHELLTPREREVLQLIAEGNTNSEMAVKMSISEKTVEKHRASLMSKLEVHDAAALVRLAIKHGLVFIDNE